MRRLFLALSLVLSAATAAAQETATACGGRDLLAVMAAPERAELDAAVAAAPFPAGNHWRATRGNATINLVGTFHLNDPRGDAAAERLQPVIASADLLLLEATEAEFDALTAALSRDPSLMVTPEPALAQDLSPEDWRALAAAMEARGVPSPIAARLRPWYVSMLLAVPPCAMDRLGTEMSGLDQRLIAGARSAGTPVAALEPFDTILRVFGSFTPEEQVRMLRAAIVASDEAEDMLTTMTESYFREEHRQIWEFSRRAALADAGEDRATFEADFALMEQVLITERNRAWLDRITAEAEGRHIVVAVGAGHLAGEDGILALLQAAGFTLDRQPF